MTIKLQIQINDKLYLRDPQETKLGKAIIYHSILLIDEIGFEQFTFKKLAERMESTEASVYRYFENKHLLLLYLLSWYWEWLTYQIAVNTTNIVDPCQKLQVVIATIVNSAKKNSNIDFVDEDVLHRIVVEEGEKGYHTKQVDKQNRAGFFLTYKALSAHIAEIIQAINPQFPYPAALASTLLEMAKDHTYFAIHLPRLTDVRVSNEDFSEVEQLLNHFAFSLIKPDFVVKK